MGLIKYRLGDLLQLLEMKNDNLQYGIDSVRGVNNLKKMMPTKADLNGRDLSKFQIVNPGVFFFNHRTSRNGSKFSITYNDERTPIICTEDYVVFKIKPDCESILLADWLYMYFNRSEFDRYVITNSWGSSTEFYNWEDICLIELELPSLPIQKKYVDIYKAMIANQQSYERGLEDLRAVCDDHFDVAKKGRRISLGKLIEKVDKKNSDGKYGIDSVRGIINQKQFADTKANLEGTDLSKFLVIDKDVFAYNSRTDGRDMLVLALNRDEESVIVTWNYDAFKIQNEKKQFMNPEYLYAYFKRSEFDRFVRFNSWGSSQELLSWDALCEMEIPFTDIEIQNAIANINRVFLERKEINERLQLLIRNICPILIKGSIEEARKEA
jgi:type I restriction enzyme S subunit